ncbi:MAG: FAD-dependent oxidoreductase [Clostridiales bacterium]|nr:FAD-dependent oxidoreductase [Clostridiales bacterium]
MLQVLVIGGGLSGCTVACELAAGGAKVTVAEKTGQAGGKVRSYGCKATDKCNNCGVCLVGGLFEKAEKNSNIDIICNAKLVDVTGGPGDYSAALKTPEGIRYVNSLSSIVVATGFEESPASSGHLQIDGKLGIVRGLELEALMKGRSKESLFDKAPQSVCFIQCVGSRDKKEGAMNCSRVCCSYSTRAAKVIRQIYPECRITFFYMELQAVASGDYFASLEELGIEFIKSRPLKITAESPATVEYEDMASGGLCRREFDIVVLSDGIHPPDDAEMTAELCRLGQDKDGFLKIAGDSWDSGVFVSGCAKRPMKIEETWADSVAVASEVLARWRKI